MKTRIPTPSEDVFAVMERPNEPVFVSKDDPRQGIRFLVEEKDGNRRICSSLVVCSPKEGCFDQLRADIREIGMGRPDALCSWAPELIFVKCFDPLSVIKLAKLIEALPSCEFVEVQMLERIGPRS